ncbi:hypothetical protein FHT79_003458 [Rhizobium sp. BK212]|uniref:hypothetical protein n=1 Tax=Rhizobium sp. BK212 TaxID=2587074 RepID=UPI001619AD4E|nr:hypothetical protein [Rhizobium sp. BK212]MBB4216271.1 hypothetical protein [Rhizobium sp. BK212]
MSDKDFFDRKVTILMKEWDIFKRTSRDLTPFPLAFGSGARRYSRLFWAAASP